MTDIVAIGGSSTMNICHRKVELYDMTTRTWSRLPDMRMGRGACPGAVVVQRTHGPRIYVFGGRNTATRLDSCEFLDVGDGQWNLIESTMNTPRSGTCAVLLDHDTVVTCGGFTPNNPIVTASCERFDLTSHTFSSFPSMILPRACHAGVHYNGTVVVMGGYGDIEENRICEQFDPGSLKWIPFAPLNFDRTGIRAAVIEGAIYVLGDNTNIEVYDGSAWKIVPQAIPYQAYSYDVACHGNILTIGEINGWIYMYDTSIQQLNVIPDQIPDNRYRVATVSF